MSMIDPRSHDTPQIMADMYKKIKDLEVQLATLRTQTTLDHGTMKNISPKSAHPQYDFGHFQQYGVVWSCVTTAPNLLDGTLLGRSARIGEIIFVHIWWQAGPSTTFGAGNFQFSLPSPIRASGYGQHITAYGGDLFVRDYSGFALADRNDALYVPQTVQVELGDNSGGPGRVNSGFPHTWGNGDFIELQGWYEGVPE